MSNNNPPLSTEGGGVMDNVDDLISTPNSDPNIPLIDLSHIKSLSDKDCPICCQYPEKDLSAGTFERGLLQLQASRCVFCKIKVLIMEAIARLEGVSPDITDKMFRRSFRDAFFYPRGKSSAWVHDVFIQSEAPRSQIYDIEDIVEIPRRNFTWDVSREDSIQRSIEWAKNQVIDQMCPCAARADDWAAPTRLIDVDPGGMGLDVQLRYSASIPQENLDYAALSYCWGGYEPECMTTPKMMNQNLRRISWESMPQTFRDTVTFTRGLGLKYLWIDSICIIQDKDQDDGGDDWRREAGRMFGVYKNAKVTFAALFGENSTTGLRDTQFEQQTRVAAKLRLDQSTYSLCVRRCHYLWNGMRGSIGIGRFPLLTRAWTYQERMMSPRKLFFTEDEIIYQCACGATCECGRAIESIESSAQEAVLRRISQGQLQYADRKIQKAWIDVVFNYSGLNLSQPKDRLAALGAIAEMFHRQRPESAYLAGLWSDSLHQDLTWYRDRFVEIRSNFRGQPDRPFNLPTWSWASLRCQVSFTDVNDPTPLAEIVTALCVYAEDNRFGTLQQSKLVLRSMVLFCSLRSDGEDYVLDVDGETQVIPFWLIDIDWEQECFPDGSEAQDVYLFQILHDRGSKDTNPDTKCLILRLKDRAANSRTFSRLGIMSYSTPRSPGSDFDDDDKTLRIHRLFEERGTTEECEIE
ncbi:heterokaryon incompatibility protein-domain-containing protein [Phyllosticta capitalensis]|uniref:heterokaryon incompatibility protein-domain-containing protein n=1 Tax=Phyllosticta capitalensis TaxID=121624 RepID=UPI003131D5A5